MLQSKSGSEVALGSVRCSRERVMRECVSSCSEMSDEVEWCWRECNIAR